MSLQTIASFDDNPDPLQLVEVAVPEPADQEIRIRVATCGVCHTELDEIEGRTPPPRLPVIPGHEVVGIVDALGRGAGRHQLGDRVGVGWIHHSSGATDENLSPEFRATGRDVNGGYAEFMTVHERYAYPIPAVFSDSEAAPLLCAGGVGYRSLMLTGIEDGQALGLTGFGGSGHLVLQLAKHLYPHSKICVFARSAREQAFALELGADWAGDTLDEPPQALHAIIDTTPAWLPVRAALRNLRPGGRLVINAIRKESSDREVLAELDYANELWLEKELKSVANVTAEDIERFLAVAADIPLKPAVRSLPLEEANRALRELRAGHLRGAIVLLINSSSNK
ncbi:MAG: alcohol dehydrogenase catalytic domain-containing protein [Woeseiaceae bacterium]|nr:alcohol dehydrogenase catalytic domain-containing protein [Woeseiaceae bacterium]